jgi:signal transduction histidine kinase
MRRVRGEVYARATVRSLGERRSLAGHEQRAIHGIAQVARALVSASELTELGRDALREIGSALDLGVTAMYLTEGDEPVTPEGRTETTVLRRFATYSLRDPGRGVTEDVRLAPEALRFLSTTGPLVLSQPTGWVMENPFVPAPESWIVLPLATSDRFLGAVVGCSPDPISLEPASAATLTAIADLLSAGIATARLRAELYRTALERERVRLAAELHDGVAQDLAVAVRELAFLDAASEAEAARASRARLREAVLEAHRVIRAGLEDLAAQVPTGGLTSAVGEIAARFARRGLDVTVSAASTAPALPPHTVAVVLRVLSEALANVRAHAGVDRADVTLQVTDTTVRLTVTDAGLGFDPGSVPPPGEGHFGVAIMRERARGAGGSLRFGAPEGGGTTVELVVPLSERVDDPSGDVH